MDKQLVVSYLGAFFLGLLVASAIFIDRIEKNDWMTDKFINDCNKQYGNESWVVTKLHGKYTCIGNNTIILQELPEGWRK